MQIIKQILLLSVLIIAGACIWPQPNKISYGNININLNEFNLSLKSHSNENIPNHFQKKWDQYQQFIFGNKNTQQNNISLTDYPIILEIENTDLFHMKADTNEKYEMIISENQTKIIAENYVGFLRAVESFSQLVRNDQSIENTPIHFEDEPYMAHRGVMLDTARHFLPLENILRTIDVLQYTKMNVLHIHFTDDESFPLEMKTEPIITEAGAFSETERYSLKDMQTMIDHAKQAGVRLIPEIDSPSHTRSWGLSDKFAPNMIICPGAEHYNGQLDITMESTYELVNSVVQDTQSVFPDEYVHLGGDEVIYSCYDKRPSIKQNMEKMGIDNYVDLQIQYRTRQKKMLQKGRSPVFWTNEKLNIPPGPTEILQYWGPYDQLHLVKDIPNKLILSPEEFTYLNKGMGFVWGQWFGKYLTWEEIYEFEPVPKDFPSDRILGAETALWSEMNNGFTNDNYLWIRTAALGERLWSKEKASPKDRVRRLVEIQRAFVKRGVDVSPVTNEYCANNIDECF